jgi:flap endonuclease-1
MGIKNLNKYLYENCSKQAISKIHLRKLSGKTIVIDTSIYLYHFLGENALMENMYLLISILKLYEITPIFIFDGKPPPEKHELLRKRYTDKKEAHNRYQLLQESLGNMTSEERKEALLEMSTLKRQCIRIYDEDIIKIKELMDAYNVTYYVSPNEADDLCVYLVKKEHAWGCMSDDMDMFLYGCPYVLRNLSLMNHTITLYNTQQILVELELSEKEFCEIMTISGTDYNIHSTTTLYETLKWFQEYKKYKSICMDRNIKHLEFYIWLLKHTKYIKNYRELFNIFHIFRGKNNYKYENMSFTLRNNMNYDKEKLHTLMQKEGFVFT